MVSDNPDWKWAPIGRDQILPLISEFIHSLQPAGGNLITIYGKHEKKKHRLKEVLTL